MHNVLVIDDNSDLPEALTTWCKLRSLRVEWVRSTTEAARKLARRDSSYHLVLLNVSNPSLPWLRLLHALQEASSRSQRVIEPPYLCVSTVQKDLLFELRIEQMGARLVYVR